MPPLPLHYLYHSSTGCYASLIALAASMVPTMPVVRSLNHPTFFQWREAFRSLRTRLYFNAPISTMLRQPCFKVVIVILLIRKNCDETRKVAINLEYQIMWRGTNRVFCNSWGVLECFPDCVATEPQQRDYAASDAIVLLEHMRCGHGPPGFAMALSLP